MNLVSHGIDRPDDHDLPWVNVLSSSGWIAGRIVMEHPAGGLGRLLPVAVEVHRPDNIAFVVDADPT
jgi:hypothetical protein